MMQWHPLFKVVRFPLLLALSFVVAGAILHVLHVTVPPALPSNIHELFQAKCHLSDPARKHLSESRESYVESRADTELRWYSSARYSGFEGMHGVVLGVPDVPEEGVFDQNKDDPSNGAYGTRDGLRIWPAVEGEWPFLRAKVPASRIIHCVNKDASSKNSDGVETYIIVESKWVHDDSFEMKSIVILVLFLVSAGALALVVWYAGRRRQMMDIRHDLRNMLNGLVNVLGQQLREEHDPQTAKKVMRTVTIRIDYLIQMVEPGHYKSKTEILHLRSLFLDLGMNVPTDVEVDLDCPDAIDIECWEEHFRRAIDNALVNAASAARVASPPLVRICVRATARTVTIVIENNGKRVPDHVLRSFGRRHSLRVRGSNVGLGLNIVRSVVWRHGGRIALDNLAPGDEVSVRLTLRLPRRQTHPLSLLAGRWRSPGGRPDATSTFHP
ncbi:MAG: HAMP domain-containing histidine kinase [Alphaproteobacteria bacterium]|nr:HAMP domain-containing histidine kinase [Alphaproteobacteria bacterium]